MHITTIGLDLAKNIFQVHGVKRDGSVAFNKPLRRAQILPFFAKLEPCMIGMEACSSAHYWARELTQLGHSVKLMPPVYVKPYVKRGKSDAADAEAICEAVRRPTMRFVEMKSAQQQAILCQHRAREMMVGHARAREIVFTADIYDVLTMEHWNVINRIVPDEMLEKEALKWAQSLANGPTLAHAMTKKMIAVMGQRGLAAADALITSESTALFDSQDMQEGVERILTNGPKNARDGSAFFKGC